MKKWIMFIMIAFSLVFLSSCIKIVTMTDMELILIDEGFSIIEYQDSQVSQMNLEFKNEFDFQFKIVRVMEGRMNQVTQVYIIEFESTSHAKDFMRFMINAEELESIEFDYFYRNRNIVIAAITEEVMSLFIDV